MAGTPFQAEFEKPILELERQIAHLRRLAEDRKLDVQEEIEPLEEKLEALRRDIYARLTPMEKVQVARHPNRPFTNDYIQMLFTDYVELKGDRLFRDDPAVVGGWARFHGRPVVIIGHQKGRDAKENLRRTFGCAHPEGYRKALRLMKMAGRFGAPVISLVDTKGAYPGIGAEERGQASAIAVNLEEMATLKVPIVTVIIGEGGSGGALAMALADKVLMMEHAWYSVISPEGCAAILWSDAAHKERAAESLGLTAPRLLELGLIDEIVEEPAGGAHRDPSGAAAALDAAIEASLNELLKLKPERLVRLRAEKYYDMGVYAEG